MTDQKKKRRRGTKPVELTIHLGACSLARLRLPTGSEEEEPLQLREPEPATIELPPPPERCFFRPEQLANRGARAVGEAIPRVPRSLKGATPVSPAALADQFFTLQGLYWRVMEEPAAPDSPQVDQLAMQLRSGFAAFSPTSPPSDLERLAEDLRRLILLQRATAPAPVQPLPQPAAPAPVQPLPQPAAPAPVQPPRPPAAHVQPPLPAAPEPELPPLPAAPEPELPPLPAAPEPELPPLPAAPEPELPSLLADPEPELPPLPAAPEPELLPLPAAPILSHSSPVSPCDPYALTPATSTPTKRRAVCVSLRLPTGSEEEEPLQLRELEPATIELPPPPERCFFRPEQLANRGARAVGEAIPRVPRSLKGATPVSPAALADQFFTLQGLYWRVMEEPAAPDSPQVDQLAMQLRSGFAAFSPTSPPSDLERLAEDLRRLILLQRATAPAPVQPLPQPAAPAPVQPLPQPAAPAPVQPPRPPAAHVQPPLPAAPEPELPPLPADPEPELSPLPATPVQPPHLPAAPEPELPPLPAAPEPELPPLPADPEPELPPLPAAPEPELPPLPAAPEPDLPPLPAAPAPVQPLPQPAAPAPVQPPRSPAAHVQPPLPAAPEPELPPLPADPEPELPPLPAAPVQPSRLPAAPEPELPPLPAAPEPELPPLPAAPEPELPPLPADPEPELPPLPAAPEPELLPLPAAPVQPPRPPAALAPTPEALPLPAAPEQAPPLPALPTSPPMTPDPVPLQSRLSLRPLRPHPGDLDPTKRRAVCVS
ncbi:basic proline-rich protein-like [Brienomyrus brachyistius]|uniref:basic proline-rich protein-like n=1 Tax=Brienomyrus brachyistius TaxID=42636 RepID=UPI0020B406B7|nr:basic proline-rich protein-like [Brienomyrus brachyistius]